MKIKSRHIQKFEAFIQNSKEPNETEDSKTKNNKKPDLAEDDNKDLNNSDNENDDPIDEMTEFIAKINKSIPNKWKYTI